MKERRLQRVCVQIERLRSKMHDAVLIYGVSHPKVLKISMNLDIKINQYIKISKEL